MISIALVTLLTGAQPQPKANPACTVLNANDVSALIGPGSKMIPMATIVTGATCMFRSDERTLTTFYAVLPSAQEAEKQWEARKKVVSGKDVTGWVSKAWEGAIATVSIVGVTKGTVFVETKLVDLKAPLAETAPKLSAVMKDVASRLP